MVDAVDDTVEWQFDRATQGHDLVSLAPSQSWETVWPTALQEYRDAGGPSVTYTFDQPGTYRYECSLHGPTMSGTIVVVPAGGANQPPTADPVVEPLTGPAPLVVHATANASDPDGDVAGVAWEFGTGGAPSYTDHAMFEYTTPGSYVVRLRLRVSDSRGGLHVEEFAVTVTGTGGPGTDPPTDGALPAIDALAAPAQGTAPLATASDTVTVVVGAAAPSTPTPPPTPVPVVDATPPRISRVGPVRIVRTSRPVVTARVRDAGSAVRKKAVVIRVDGRRPTKVRWDRARGIVRWRPAKALAPGRHVVRLVATDAAGNRAARRWRFVVRLR